VEGGFAWSDRLDGLFGTQWDRFALNVFKGSGDRDPASQQNAPPIDFSLFKQDGDNPIVWILTPGANFGTTSELYPEKVASLASMISDELPDAAIKAHIYRKLKYKVTAAGTIVALDLKDPQSVQDAATANRDCFGCMLFQYVFPTRFMKLHTDLIFRYDGDGNWRLFLEQTQIEQGTTV
jgi:hypothetical protein